MTSWLTQGAPAEKLLLGFPTYGRTYRLRSGNTDLGAPANGPAEPGPYTRTAGLWAYYEVQHINEAVVCGKNSYYILYVLMLMLKYCHFNIGDQ